MLAIPLVISLGPSFLCCYLLVLLLCFAVVVGMSIEKFYAWTGVSAAEKIWLDHGRDDKTVMPWMNSCSGAMGETPAIKIFCVNFGMLLITVCCLFIGALTVYAVMITGLDSAPEGSNAFLSNMGIEDVNMMQNHLLSACSNVFPSDFLLKIHELVGHEIGATDHHGHTGDLNVNWGEVFCDFIFSWMRDSLALDLLICLQMSSGCCFGYG